MSTSNQLYEAFYKSLDGKGAMPLEPDDPYYVEILSAEPAKDPILRLQQRIKLVDSESVNLLTGFRGNGKSTQLRRLRRLLEDEGHVVFLINMLDYMLMTKPVELSDFILSLMAALSTEVGKSKELDLQPLAESYWERLKNFFPGKIELESLNLPLLGPSLGAKLKTEVDFKNQIQEKLRGHLEHLVRDAQEFVDKLVCDIREKKGSAEIKVVLLVDSVEQLRGQGTDANKVYNSMVELFCSQAHNLGFPKLHVVYTVPPYLKALTKNLGRSLGGNFITQWPNIHVRRKEDGGQDAQGLAVMEKIITKRCPNWQQVFAPEDLAALAHISGGDVRDFFRLLRDCLITLILSPEQSGESVDQEILDRAIQTLRNDMLPLADKDAQCLAKIYRSKYEELPSVEDVSMLARFLDTNTIMNYENGKPWYDIHPILVQELQDRGFLAEHESPSA